MALKWYPSCSHAYILAQGRPWLFGGPVQNKKWRPLFTIKIQDTSSIHHKNCYINHLPRKSSSSPFGTPRSNSSTSMRASGRRKTGSVVFPHGPRQLIIASPRRNCRNEETMVNMINGLISILGPCLFPRTFLSPYHIKRNLTILKYQIKSVYKFFLTAEC